MSAFIPLLIAYGIGALVMRPLLSRTSLKHPFLLLAAAAGPVGLGILSLGIFAAYTISAANGRILLFTAVILGGAWLLQRSIFSTTVKYFDFERSAFSLPSGNRLLWLLRACCITLFIFSLAVYLKAFISMTCLAPNGDWDARFFWNVKAKFYLREPEAWKSMFSSVIAWSHPDYPLLVPGAVAWGWNWAGQETLLWPALTALVFSLSIAALVVWHLAETRNWETGIIAAAFLLAIEFFRYWSASQYADIPQAFFFLASTLLLVHFLKNKNTECLFLAGLTAGLSAWTKNEGIFFILWLFVTACLYRGKKWLLDSSTRKELLYFVLGLLPALLAIFALKTVFATQGDYLGSKRTLSDYFHLVFQAPENTHIIFSALKSYTFQTDQWHGLWHMGAAAVGINLIKGVEYKRWDESWCPAVLTILILSGYVLIIHVTPHPVVWQIQTALTRLLLHITPLVLVFAFEVFAPESLFPAAKNSSHN